MLVIHFHLTSIQNGGKLFQHLALFDLESNPFTCSFRTVDLLLVQLTRAVRNPVLYIHVRTTRCVQ
jgi:hypothetical protein